MVAETGGFVKVGWVAGVSPGDLAACRSVFSTLLDTADAATVAAFEGEVKRLADQIETALRTTLPTGFAKATSPPP